MWEQDDFKRNLLYACQINELKHYRWKAQRPLSDLWIWVRVFGPLQAQSLASLANKSCTNWFPSLAVKCVFMFASIHEPLYGHCLYVDLYLWWRGLARALRPVFGGTASVCRCYFCCLTNTGGLWQGNIILECSITKQHWQCLCVCKWQKERKQRFLSTCGIPCITYFCAGGLRGRQLFLFQTSTLRPIMDNWGRKRARDKKRERDGSNKQSTLNHMHEHTQSHMWLYCINMNLYWALWFQRFGKHGQNFVIQA